MTMLKPTRISRKLSSLCDKTEERMYCSTRIGSKKNRKFKIEIFNEMLNQHWFGQNHVISTGNGIMYRNLILPIMGALDQVTFKVLL